MHDGHSPFSASTPPASSHRAGEREVESAGAPCPPCFSLIDSNPTLLGMNDSEGQLASAEEAAGENLKRQRRGIELRQRRRRGRSL